MLQLESSGSSNNTPLKLKKNSCRTLKIVKLRRNPRARMYRDFTDATLITVRNKQLTIRQTAAKFSIPRVEHTPKKGAEPAYE